MKKQYLYCFLICMYISISTTGDGQDMRSSLNGDSYTQGTLTEKQISVTFINKGYTLQKLSAKYPSLNDTYVALPYERNVKCYIVSNGKIIKPVVGLDDLRGFVILDSAKKALEFVRLRTSLQTFFLFGPEMAIEVYSRTNDAVKSEWGVTSSDYIHKYNLEDFKMATINENEFIIERTLIYFSWKDYPAPAKLYRVTERISRDGYYRVDKKLLLEKVKMEEIPYPAIPPK